MDMAVMQKIVDGMSVKELLAFKEKIEERLIRNIDFKVLDKLYDGKIEPNSTICADSHNAYKKFADGVPAELIQIERGQHKKGIYHINNINSMHSKIKTWIRPFNGVATKYLGHYMYWFNWCEKNRRVDCTEKDRRLILDSFSSTITYTQADVRATKAF